MEKPAEERRNRRPRRSKADIEAAIEKAAIKQIKRMGFAHSQVTDIVKEAEIEPIVFYNRYKNLNDFFDQFVTHYDHWLKDACKGKSSPTNSEEYAKLLGGLLDYLHENDIITELLRWEVSENTSTTRRMAKVHEEDVNDYVDHLMQHAKHTTETDERAVMALVVAGLFYLTLHKERSSFAGIDIKTTEGRDRIKKALKQIGTSLYPRQRITKK